MELALFWLTSFLAGLTLSFAQNSSHCSLGLRAETHGFALHHYPPQSETYRKVQNLLISGKENRAMLFIADPSVFAGVGKRIAKILEAIEMKVVILNDYRKLISEYNPGHDLLIDLAIDLQISTVHPEWECAIPIPPHEYYLHNRIIVQSEQLNGRFRADILPFLKACHQSSTCIIWEYSDHNYKLLKDDSDVYLSTIVLPIMFQDLDPVKPLPLAQRNMDYYGAASLIGRRRDFYDMITKYSRENHLTGGYGLNRKADQLASGHQHARVCICIHVESTPSPGEYHRLSDVARYGCVPVYERFADVLWARSLSECGNVHFASTPAEVIQLTQMISLNITASPAEWQSSVNESLVWWSHQLEDINFILKDIFFPVPPARRRNLRVRHQLLQQNSSIFTL